jgi:hypothetical protein
MGGKAKAAWDRAGIKNDRLKIYRTHHASPKSLNTSHVRRQEIADTLRKVARELI